LFGADCLPVLRWYSLDWPKRFAHPFYGGEQTIFACTAIYVHRQFGGGVTGKFLRLFYGDATFDYHVDVGRATGVKIQLATRSVFGDTCRLQVLVECARGVGWHVEKGIFRRIESGALAGVETVVLPSSLTGLRESRQPFHKPFRKALETGLPIFRPCRIQVQPATLYV